MGESTRADPGAWRNKAPVTGRKADNATWWSLTWLTSFGVAGSPSGGPPAREQLDRTAIMLITAMVVKMRNSSSIEIGLGVCPPMSSCRTCVQVLFRRQCKGLGAALRARRFWPRLTTDANAMMATAGTEPLSWQTLFQDRFLDFRDAESSYRERAFAQSSFWMQKRAAGARFRAIAAESASRAVCVILVTRLPSLAFVLTRMEPGPLAYIACHAFQPHQLESPGESPQRSVRSPPCERNLSPEPHRLEVPTQCGFAYGRRRDPSSIGKPFRAQLRARAARTGGCSPRRREILRGSWNGPTDRRHHFGDEHQRSVFICPASALQSRR